MQTMPSPACDDLFDSIAQTVFGIGLQLEECLHSTEDPATREKIDSAILKLHDIITRVRERGELRCEIPQELEVIDLK